MHAKLAPEIVVVRRYDGCTILLSTRRFGLATLRRVITTIYPLEEPMEYCGAARLRIQHLCERAVSHQKGLAVHNSWPQSVPHTLLILIVSELPGDGGALPHTLHRIQAGIPPSEHHIFYEIDGGYADAREVALTSNI